MNNSEEISTTYQSTIPFEPTTIITNIPTTSPEVKETTVITEVTETTIITEVKETTIITEVKETTIITEEKEPTIITEEISNSDKIDEKPIPSIIQETTTKKREEILKDLNSLIKDKQANQTYIIEGSDFTVIIKPINKYVEDSTVNIDFSECETILRKENPSSDFIFLQVNMENTNKNCLTEQVEYKVYNALLHLFNNYTSFPSVITTFF
jgi:hypothetical protein